MSAPHKVWNKTALNSQRGSFSWQCPYNNTNYERILGSQKEKVPGSQNARYCPSRPKYHHVPNIIPGVLLINGEI